MRWAALRIAFRSQTLMKTCFQDDDRSLVTKENRMGELRNPVFSGIGRNLAADPGGSAMDRQS